MTKEEKCLILNNDAMRNVLIDRERTKVIDEELKISFALNFAAKS